MYYFSGLCDAAPALFKLYLSQSRGQWRREAGLYDQQAGNEPEKYIWALSPAALLPFSTNLTIEFNKHNAYWSGGEPHGAARGWRSRTQQDLLRVDAASINKETRLRVAFFFAWTPPRTHAHIWRRQSLNTQMISHQCAPHTCATLRSFPWP